MDITPLSDALGASITGIDLSTEITEDAAASIRQALLDNVILVFPGQDLSAPDQERFCRLFGELERVRTTKSVGGKHPSVMMITNVKDTGQPTALEDGEMMFHYDQCYYEQPCLGSTLFALEIPDEGGNTLFSNCAMAYDTLSDDWKARLDGLKALNYYDYGGNPTMRPETFSPDVPQWTHPVVRIHPETGRKALYVNRLMSMRIDGLSKSESDEILTICSTILRTPTLSMSTAGRWVI